MKNSTDPYAFSSSGISPNNLGVVLQRGGEELILEKALDRFTIRPQNNIASQKLSPNFLSTWICSIPKMDLELFSVTPTRLEAAMVQARSSQNIIFASHVYKLRDYPGTFVYLSDQITIEFAAEVNDKKILAITAEFGLVKERPVLGLVNTWVFLVSKQATENPIKIANRLTGFSEILAAEANIIIQAEPHYKPREPLYPQQWYLNHNGGNLLAPGAHIDVEKAWDVTRGVRSVVVAVVDDSFDLDHPDFQGVGKIVAPRDLKENDFLPLPNEKETSHGTACAGIVLAEENSIGITGVAPGCTLMPIRTTGYLDDRSVEEIFEWAIDKGASIISCSWGASAVYFPLSLRQRAVITRAATQGRNGKGCVILFAAGNANRPIDGTVYEQGWIKNILRGNTKWLNGFGVHPDVITVSAATSMNKKAAYSNWGRNISVCAPSNNALPGMWFQETGFVYTQPSIRQPVYGRGMLTTDQLGAAGYGKGNFTSNFGGTSSATPVVAGVAALILSVNPNLTAKQVKHILQETTDKIVDSEPDPQLGLRLGSYDENGHSQWFGYGKVNAAKAVQVARASTIASPLATKQVGGSNRTRLVIPDNDSRGVKSRISITDSSPIKDIQVTVDVNHEFLGDLEIYLFAPNNQKVLLQNRTLGRQTYLNKTYTTRSNPALKQFLSISAKGNWQILIIDLALQDIGSLNSWELVLGI
ncbi:S8 family serine peptidase [Mastigocoleus sp. MO_188.B34]|uniref:S8 family serine peptidase n=1 Tax=Mastigocoleus sp. MO_188.B34 TaxID=3036635 RepID=UPI00260CE896|nr:S8 family serine peptidase [Mastigocoleus sp. MO_188.B34]MDJ0692801.1 S8 family serine peptidase [Mastigocoleus sp. MO_188.B34]